MTPTCLPRAFATLLALTPLLVPSVAKTQTFAYVTTLGTDTLALERYERTGDVISGDYATVFGSILVHHYVVHLTPAGAVDHMTMTVHRRDAAPTDTLQFQLIGDTALLSDNRWPERTRRVRAPGFFPMFVGLNALEETAVSYARTKPGDSLTVPIFAVWANFDSAHFRVLKYSPDSVGVWSRATPGLLTLDRDGHVVRASARLTTTRTETVRVPPFDLNRVLRSMRDTPPATRATAFPVLSPRDSLAATVGNAHLRIAYGRPALRGRDVFAGGVLGDTVWRAGANEATRFSTDHDLMIDGKLLRAGHYTLWMRVAADNSAYALIFSSQPGHGCLDYRPQFDLLDVPLRAETVRSLADLLTLTVEPMGDGKGRLVARWGHTQLSAVVATAPERGGT